MAFVYDTNRKNQYKAWWNSCKISTDKQGSVNWAVGKIIANRDKYEAISKRMGNGIPWWIIGCIHGMEISFKMGWLANGDSLSGPTTHVPAGLTVPGKNPPYDFVDAAVVSLQHERWKNHSDWSIEHCLFLLESYNGPGYANKGLPSQYLWSFTNIAKPGKYVADGVWDPNAWSDQVGCAAMLKELQNRGIVRFDGELPQPTPDAPTVGDVTWFGAFLLIDADKQAIDVGVAPYLKGSDTPYPMLFRDSVSPDGLKDFLNKFPNAKSILQREADKPWPGDAPTPPQLPLKLPLRNGDKGVDVEILQKALNDHRGAGLTVDGDFGPATEAAVRDAEAAAKLTNDGVADAFLWAELMKMKPDTSGFTRAKALGLAVSEAQKDISWNGNGLAKRYTKKFEPEFGTGRFSWCAAFVTWCCEQSGLNIPMKVPGDPNGYTFALVEAWQQWAIRRGFWIDGGVNGKPQPGDIVCFDWDGATFPDRDGEDHIGFVMEDQGANVKCAEGNTNDKTDIKIRAKSLIQGYIRIPDGFRF